MSVSQILKGIQGIIRSYNSIRSPEFIEIEQAAIKWLLTTDFDRDWIPDQRTLQVYYWLVTEDIRIRTIPKSFLPELKKLEDRGWITYSINGKYDSLTYQILRD